VFRAAALADELSKGAGLEMSLELQREQWRVVETEWRPKIIVFCCHRCAPGAADTAGIMRLQYPPEVLIIRVPCSGRVDEEFILRAFAGGTELTEKLRRVGVDEEFILRAFAGGADGVVVAGCLEGTCHYLVGNTRAARRVERMRTFLSEVGLEAERLEMHHMAASMGTSFARMAADFTGRVRLLGPAFPAVHAASAEGGSGL